MTPETSAAHAASDHRPIFVAETGRPRITVRAVGWGVTAVAAAWLAAVVAGAAGFGTIPGLGLPGVRDPAVDLRSGGQPAGGGHARGSEPAPAHAAKPRLWGAATRGLWEPVGPRGRRGGTGAQRLGERHEPRRIRGAGYDIRRMAASGAPGVIRPLPRARSSPSPGDMGGGRAGEQRPTPSGALPHSGTGSGGRADEQPLTPSAPPPHAGSGDGGRADEQPLTPSAPAPAGSGSWDRGGEQRPGTSGPEPPAGSGSDRSAIPQPPARRPAGS
jgi:hypothetical protein